MYIYKICSKVIIIERGKQLCIPNRAPSNRGSSSFFMAFVPVCEDFKWICFSPWRTKPFRVQTAYKWFNYFVVKFNNCRIFGFKWFYFLYQKSKIHTCKRWKCIDKNPEHEQFLNDQLSVVVIISKHAFFQHNVRPSHFLISYAFVIICSKLFFYYYFWFCNWSH